MWVYFILLLFLGEIHSQNDEEYQRFCYMSSWARHRRHPVNFIPENIDVSLCTHIAYAFAVLDGTGTKLVPSEKGDDPKIYKRFNALKRRNPRLKTLLSFGGWEMGSEGFSRLVSSDKRIHVFANNTIRLLRDRGFDGLDLDWEFPASRGSPPTDKYRFSKFVQILRESFDKEGARRPSKRRLLLTAAVGPSVYQMGRSYEPHVLGRYLDYINLMTYDMHGLWGRDKRKFHHAALYGRPEDKTHNIDYVTKQWITMRVPKRKLLVGLPFYSRTYTATGGSDHYTGPGQPGQYTNTRGYLAYYEVCEKLQQGATGNVISEQKVPYIQDHNQWMGYDDEKSLQEKVKYAVNNGLGGVMVWALDLDDFSGLCGKSFPLLNAVNDEFYYLKTGRQRVHIKDNSKIQLPIKEIQNHNRPKNDRKQIDDRHQQIKINDRHQQQNLPQPRERQHNKHHQNPFQKRQDVQSKIVLQNQQQQKLQRGEDQIIRQQNVKQREQQQIKQNQIRQREQNQIRQQEQQQIRQREQQQIRQRELQQIRQRELQQIRQRERQQEIRQRKLEVEQIQERIRQQQKRQRVNPRQELHENKQQEVQGRQQQQQQQRNNQQIHRQHWGLNQNQRQEQRAKTQHPPNQRQEQRAQTQHPPNMQPAPQGPRFNQRRQHQPQNQQQQDLQRKRHQQQQSQQRSIFKQPETFQTQRPQRQQRNMSPFQTQNPRQQQYGGNNRNIQQYSKRPDKKQRQRDGIEVQDRRRTQRQRRPRRPPQN